MYTRIGRSCPGYLLGGTENGMRHACRVAGGTSRPCVKSFDAVLLSEKGTEVAGRRQANGSLTATRIGMNTNHEPLP